MHHPYLDVFMKTEKYLKSLVNSYSEGHAHNLVHYLEAHINYLTREDDICSIDFSALFIKYPKAKNLLQTELTEKVFAVIMEYLEKNPEKKQELLLEAINLSIGGDGVLLRRHQPWETFGKPWIELKLAEITIELALKYLEEAILGPQDQIGPLAGVLFMVQSTAKRGRLDR